MLRNTDKGRLTGRESGNVEATSSAELLLTILPAGPSTDVEDSDTRQKCRGEAESGFL